MAISYEKKEETQEMAKANRAFTHFCYGWKYYFRLYIFTPFPLWSLLFFLSLLVPKIKNRSILIPIVISLTENSLHDKRSIQVSILNIKKSHIIIFHFL